MKARGRSIWKSTTGNFWIYEARIPKKNDSGYLKIQRRAKTRSEAARRVEKAYEALLRQSKLDEVMTCRRLVESYLAHSVNHKRLTTVANYKDLLERYFLTQFGSKKANQITKSEIYALLTRLRERGLKAESVNTVRLRIQGLFTWAVKFQYVESNPATGIEKFKPKHDDETQVQTPWSVSEVRAFLSAVQGTPIDFVMHATVTLGLRRGEALALRWSDIDFESGHLEIRRSRGSRRVLNEKGRIETVNFEGPTKTDSSRRRLPLTELLSLALLRERERQGRLGHVTSPNDHIALGVNGKPLSDCQLSRLYNRICKANNIRRIRIHDHRHTSAIHALESGVREESVSEALGHSSTEVTRRIYAPKVPALSRAFAENLAEMYEPDLYTSSNARREDISNETI